jgi:YesN/AraC family two-component response regulator
LSEYIQSLRVAEARRPLQNETTAVEEISAAVGYEDTSFFRRLFKRATGLTPSKYRLMFKPIVAAAT